MIARIWQGYTTPQNANAYHRLLTSKILPGIHRVAAFRGTYLMRQDGPEEVEFITLTLWDSMDAIRQFAGEDYERAVVPQEARKLLAHFDERSVHYATEWAP